MKRGYFIILYLLFSFCVFSQDDVYLREACNQANNFYSRKDYANALEWYQKAAEGGHSFAQFRLGYMYSNGYGVKQDYKKAIGWYLKSADQGNAQAQANLGYMYRYGNGVARDYEKAVEWYQKAADQGNAQAQANLGYMYEFGYGLSRDQEKAVEWYKKSADQDYANAQHNLGNMYELGSGVTRDYKKAAEWFQKAANQGNSNGQNRLGQMYETGRGVEKDYKKALYWYQKAADQGNAFAVNNLGNMYESGFGVEKDYVKAFEYFKISAEKGIPAGMNNLAWCYMYGAGVSQDYSSAVKWLKKAIKEGYSRAYAHLGNCYFYGWGVSQDTKQAVVCYEKAIMDSDKPQTNAYCKLGECYLLGVGVPQDYGQAIEMFKKATDNSLANFYLSLCYEMGLGVLQDLKKSQEYMQRTEKLGYPIVVSTPQPESEGNRKVVYTLKYNSGYSTQQVEVREVTTENIQQRLLSTRLDSTEEYIAHLPSVIGIKTDVLSAIDLSGMESAQVGRITPRILILSPSNNSSFNSSELLLKYHIDTPGDAPVTELIVKIDNEVQPKYRGLSFGDDLQLELPKKDCVVLLQAMNKYGLGDAIALNLKWDDSEQRIIPPNLYVLAIGINNYERMPKLSYAVKDMNDFATSVESKKNYPYANVVVKRLYDETAKRQDVEDGLEWLKEVATDKDFSFIYFAGHGLKDERDRFHFIPSDGNKDRMASTCISASHFIDDYLSIIPGKVVVFTDACYSGALHLGRRGSVEFMDAVKDMLRANSDVLFYSATSDDTVAQEAAETQNGIFTKALLEAFSGEGERKSPYVLTTMELQEYLRKRMQVLSNTQKPNFRVDKDIPLFTY